MREKNIKVVIYEQDRLCFFLDQVSLAQNKYNRLYKTFKEAPYLSEGVQSLRDAERELQFYKDVVEMLEKGCDKQSEGEWESNHQTDEYICSLCGAIAPVDCLKEDFYKSKFCPNCGAKMKGGADK